MLKDILTGERIAAFLLIEDYHSAKGEDLFKTILINDQKNNTIQKIHLFCFENPPEHYLCEMDTSKIETHNLICDSFWMKEKNFDYFSVFDKIIDSQNKQSTVMIDSLNMLLVLGSCHTVCHLISKLKEAFQKVTSQVHRDVIKNPGILKSITFYSDIVMKVNLENQEKSRHCFESGTHRTVEISHKKSSGKVVCEKEVFRIDSNYNVHSEIFKKKDMSLEGDRIKDSFKNLTTFSLGLDMKENEKIARNNLVLPYLRSEEKKEDEGQIIYVAEACDDLEEDPDDDLDI